MVTNEATSERIKQLESTIAALKETERSYMFLFETANRALSELDYDSLHFVNVTDAMCTLTVILGRSCCLSVLLIYSSLKVLSG